VVGSLEPDGRLKFLSALEISEMKKFRLDKWGQLRIPSEDEPAENFIKGERWTVRPIFVIAVAILFAIVLIFEVLKRR
jgi:hypothetical protein